MEKSQTMPLYQTIRIGGISCIRPNKTIVFTLLAAVGILLLLFKAPSLPAIPHKLSRGYPFHFPLAASNPNPSDEPLIANQVWQCYTTVGARDRRIAHLDALKKTKLGEHEAATWLPVDGAWTYSFVGSEAGEAFVRAYFADQPDVVAVYTGLRLPVMVSDFLRYLLLAGAGGAYADSDVQMVRRLDEWVPAEYRNVTRAVVGLEKDTGAEEGGWRTSFAQYVLYAGKGHPIMTKMVRNITDTVLRMANGSSIAELKIRDKDVLQITGPRGFSSIVYGHLGEQVGRSVDYRDVSNITSPKLFGDTLILPINYFGAGQAHSGSRGDSKDELVRHYFKGSWRHGR